MKRKYYLALALLLLTVSLVLNARPLVQSPSSATSGKLSGLILDLGQDRVSRAKIIVERKGLQREVISDDDGSYVIELPEGKYNVRVECDGFYPFKKKNVRVRSEVTTKMDISLTVGKSETLPRVAPN
jgi:uncharacterized membrane protein